MRPLRVLLLRWKEMSLKDFLLYLKSTFYLNEPYLVYCYNISQIESYEVKEIVGYQIEKGNLSELNQTLMAIKDCPWEYRCHLHDNVTVFYVAKNESGIQHISWVYLKGDHNRLLSLNDNEIELKHGYTLPGARGRGITPSVINYIKNDVKLRGITRIFTTVHPQNAPSIKSLEKAGFDHVGKLRFLKILGIACSRRLRTNKILV